MHATTFGANPVCAVAGLVVQETLSDDFLQEVTAKGEYLRGAIEALDLPCFGKTRGLGLMIGIEVKEGYTNKEIAGKLIENGLLVLTAGHAAAAAAGDLQGGDGPGRCHHEKSPGLRKTIFSCAAGEARHRPAARIFATALT